MRLLLSNRQGLGRRALAGALSVAMALSVNVLTQADGKELTDYGARTAVTVTGSAIDFNDAIVDMSGNNAIVSGTTLRLGKANENGACGVEIANPFAGNEAMASQSIVDALGGEDATYNCYVWRRGTGADTDNYYVAPYATVEEAQKAAQNGQVTIVTDAAALIPLNTNWTKISDTPAGMTVMNLAQIVSADAVSTTAVGFPLPEWETGATVSMWVKASSATKTPIFVFQDRKDNFVDPNKKANDQFGGAVLFTDGSFIFNQDDYSCGSNGTKRSTYAVETTSNAVPSKNLGKWVFVTISIQNDGVEVYYDGQKAVYTSKMAQAATNTRYFNYGYGYKEDQGTNRVKNYWTPESAMSERLSESPYAEVNGTVKDLRTNVRSEGQVASDMMQYLTSEDTTLFLGGDDGKGSIFNSNAKVTFAYSNDSRDLQISGLAFYDVPSDQAKATELYNAQKDFDREQNIEAPESDYFDYLSYNLTNSIVSTGCSMSISGDSIRLGKGVSGAACGVQVTNPFSENAELTSQTILEALGGAEETFNCYVWRRGSGDDTDAYYIAPYSTVEEAKAAAQTGKVKIVTDVADLTAVNSNWTEPDSPPVTDNVPIVPIMNLSQLVKDEEITLSRSAVDVFDWSNQIITSGSLKVLSPDAVVLPTTVSAEGISTLDDMLFKTNNLTLSASAATAITPDGNGGVKTIDGGNETYTFANGYAQGNASASGENANWRANQAVVEIAPETDTVFVMSFLWNNKKLYVLEKDENGAVTALINGVDNPNGSNAQVLKFEVKAGNTYQVYAAGSKIMVSYMGYEDVEELKVETPIAGAASDAALSFPLPEWETGATISTWVKASSETKAPIFTFVDKGGNGSKMYGTEGTYGGATLYTDGSFQFYQDEATISAVGNGAKRNAYVVSTQNDNVPSKKVGEWTYVTISIQNDGVDVYFNGEKAEYSIASDFDISNGKNKAQYFNYSYGYKGLQNKVAALVSHDFFGARLAYYMDGEAHAVSDPINNKVGDLLTSAKAEGLDAEDLMHYLTSEETELYLGGDDGSARSGVNGFEQLNSGKWVGAAMAPYTEASEGMIISGFRAAEIPVLTEALAKSLYELALDSDTKDEPEEPEEPTVPTEEPDKTEEPGGTTTNPPSGTTTNPPSGTTTNPPSGTTTNPPSGTTTNPPSGTTTNPPSGTTTNPPSGTTTNPPSGTTTNPPSGTTTNPPSGTTTNPPSGTQTTPPEPNKVMLGDVNLDGKVDLSDANAALLEALSIGTPLTGDAFKAADVNLDGKVTLEDANIILRVALGIESFEKAVLVTKLGL